MVRAAQNKSSSNATRRTSRIASADGRQAVEAWLNNVKPELQPIARKIDKVILRTMPDAVCVVKWNVPFYGLRGQGWIVAINSFKAHVKLLFFGAADLKPKPPAGKTHNAIDFHSNEELDHDLKQVNAWLQQAREVPGWGRNHRELRP